MLIRKLVVIISTLPFVFISLLLLLYSSILANNKTVINLRNSYFVLTDKVTPRGLFIYKARATSIEPDGRYMYMFPGKFQDINFKEKTITLKDLYNKSWTFRYSTNKNKNGNKSEFESIDYRYIIKKSTTYSTSMLNKISVDTVNPDSTVSHFAQDDLIVLYWTDDRKLTEIIKANTSGEIIKMNGAELIQINKVVWK